MTTPNWQAQWIWPVGHAWTVDFHGFARKAWTLEAAPDAATLRVSAYTDYAVNGTRVGRGPEPCDPWFQTYDSYDVAALLRPGENVLGIVVHNYGQGVHWYNRGRGGLIAQLDMESGGERMTVATDDSWRVVQADCYAPNSPRAFWSAGFLETFDFHGYYPAWLRPGFDDGGWQSPEVLGPVGTKPWVRLLPREIPLLCETPTDSVRAERGNFDLPPLQALSFAPLLPPGQVGVVYARTTLTSGAAHNFSLHVECDDAFKLFVNGALTLEQNYSEYFARTRVWRGKDVYDQVHDGMGDVGYDVTVALDLGANDVVVAVDQGPRGWGFLLGCSGADFGPWRLSGPLPSTGLNDSLDGVTAEGGPDTAGWEGGCSDVTAVTDYAMLMSSERRGPTVPTDWREIALSEGEFCILDLGVVCTGYPALTLDAAEEAVLDVGTGQILHDDKRLRFSNGGRLKAVDRVIMPPGTHEWAASDRRTARFLHLSCRRGRVTVRRPHLLASGYPVQDVGAFECSDAQLNRIWETSITTSKLLMQQGWQDCLKREQGTLNTSSFNYASRGAACAFGDLALGRKNLRQAYRTQNESGWLDSHGLSSPNSDEVTECLWLAVWLRDYHAYSGDLEFVAEVYDALEDNLRFFDKGINRWGLIEGRNRPYAWQGEGVYLDDSLLSYPYSGRFAGELAGFNLLYYAALEAAADLARHLDRPDRADDHARRAARVAQSFNARFWDGDRGLYRDSRDGDELGQSHHPIIQIAALYFGLGDEAQSQALFNYLTYDLGLPDEGKTDYPLFTFGFYFYFLENLFRAGKDTLALDLMRRVHGRWLDLGGTTFGEFFELPNLAGKTSLPDEYEVHAYGASAHLHFYTNILGVRPLEPGYAKILIAPHLGDLEWAKGILATPLGLIHVAWRREEGGLTLELVTPPGCASEIRLPDGIGPARVTLNGEHPS